MKATSSQGRIVFNYLYNYADSDKIYFGTERALDMDKALALTSIQNEHVAAFEYIANPQLSLFLEVPFQYNVRSLNTDMISGGRLTGRLAQRSDGLGDIRLYLRRWLCDPQCSPDGNVSILVGATLPTGNEDSGALYQGEFIFNDVSIQTGTGSWQVPLGVYTYRRIGWLTGFFGAYYRLAPANQTGARALDPSLMDPNSTVLNSIPDMYSWDVGARAALGQLAYGDNAPGDPGLVSRMLQATGVTFAVHGSGIPEHDVIGNNSGFRRAYTAIFLRPGVDVRVNDRLSMFINTPITVYRNLTTAPGSFPNFQVNAGVAFRF